MAASETSKPGFWLVVLRVCVCSPYVCRYNYSLSWLLCLNVCDSGVTWMTVGHLSLQVLSTSLCVVIVTCSLFTVCDSFLSREKNEREGERAETHAMCCAVTWGTKPHIQRPRGDEANEADDPIRTGAETQCSADSEDTHSLSSYVCFRAPTHLTARQAKKPRM